MQVQKVIYNQRQKEVRKFHSEASAEDVLQSWAAQFANDVDSGHLTAATSPFAAAAAEGPNPELRVLAVAEPQLGSVNSDPHSVSSPTSPMPTVTEGANEAQSRSTSGRTCSGSLQQVPLAQVRLRLADLSFLSVPLLSIVSDVHLHKGYAWFQ